MSLSYELRREQHAIGEFTASLHFFQPVSAPIFSAVTDVLKGLAGQLNLPALIQMPLFQFTLGPQGAGFGSPDGQSGGLGFQRFSPSGEVEESVVCNAASITYVLRDYTVWEKVGPNIVNLFSKLAFEYIKEVPAIESIRVQYLNEFSSKEGSTQSAAELFRDGNGWVAPIVCGSNQSWHSHVGVYIPHDANERRLVNVNCDISPRPSPGERGPRTDAKVLVFAGCFFNVPGGRPLVVSADGLADAIKTKFDEAHALEKSILGDLISDDYLKAIGASNVE